MATPTGSNLLLDPTGIPIPQLWDPVLSAWYAFATLDSFKIGGASGNVSGYHFGCVAMGGAGWFRGAAGSYKSTSGPAGIMVFNSTTEPGAVAPEYFTPV